MRRLAALVPAALLLTGCGPAFDAAGLAGSVGPAFGHLYVRAQELTGRTDLRRADLGVQTSCTRGGGDTLDRGPGDDWACVVSFRETDGGLRQVRYEVTLKPTGCWSADGPPAVVGDATVLDADGRSRLNPVYAFDGCLQS